MSLATVESHGERTLYDIIIPEPGALLWSFVSDSPDLDLPYPEPDTVLFNKICASNVHLHLSDAAAAFSVQDLTPMPNPYIKSAPPKSASKSSQEDANAAYSYAELVDVPDGYKATRFSVMITGDIESVVQPTRTYSVGGLREGLER